MANEKLRAYAKAHNVYLWEIAIALGVCENTITRKMRVELTDEDNRKMKEAIDKVAKEKWVEI